MTFDANQPNAAQSPSLFPAANITNMTRLKTLFNVEHVFSDSVSANQGTHRLVTLTSSADPVALPAGTNGIFYLNNGRLKFYNGTIYSYVPPLLAAVTFNAAGTIQGTATNIASVVKNGTGDYSVNFSTALPNTSGQWSVHASNQGHPTVGLVATLISNTTASVRIRVTEMDDSLADPVFCSYFVQYGY